MKNHGGIIIGNNVITRIDITAAGILNMLDEKKGPISIIEIESFFEINKDLAHRSIGRLVREGYVHLVFQGTEQYLCNC